MQNYKEVYAEELSTLREFLKKNVERQEAIRSWEHFNKHLQLTTIYEDAREQCPLDGLQMAYGDYRSPIMVVLPSFDSPVGQLFTTKIREYLEEVSNETRTYLFSEICMVSFGKGTTDIDHVKLLGYEIGILKPSVVLSLVKMNVPGVDVRYFEATPQTIEDKTLIFDYLSVIKEKLPTENKKAS